MKKNKLQIYQLERKLKKAEHLNKLKKPTTGWIRAIRLSLGMTLQQLGNKLSKSKQGIYQLENREQSGNITLKSLEKTADALDMKLVYAFVPKDGSLDALIERKAKELAVKIVSRTSNTMKLEAQENSKERIEQSITERTAILKYEMPKILWD